MALPGECVNLIDASVGTSRVHISLLHDVVMHIVAKVTMVYYTKPMTYIIHRYYIIISEVVKNPSSLGVAVGTASC